MTHGDAPGPRESHVESPQFQSANADVIRTGGNRQSPSIVWEPGKGVRMA